jgi:uncharacterized protein (TIGR03382 family)
MVRGQLPEEFQGCSSTNGGASLLALLAVMAVALRGRLVRQRAGRR